MRPGMAPIANLARALSSDDALHLPDASILRSSSLGLVEATRAAGLAYGESLLVVADQFEELFRYQQRHSGHDDAEAALFVNLLLTAAGRPDTPVYVVLTMRSDFLGDCAQFPGLPEALSDSQYLIPRLTREQRRQAIEEPLLTFNAAITSQLVEQLLNDSNDEVGEVESTTRYRGGAPDPLPVLQHALSRTYQRWLNTPAADRSTALDLSHYREAGGTSAALNQHAESLYNENLDAGGRQWAERIFRCLTTVELGRPIRRPTFRDDLHKIIGAHSTAERDEVNRVLALFAQPGTCFLQINSDGSVDLSHESLIWKWLRLSEWVSREAASAELFRDLMKDADAGATWVEPKLSHALTVREQGCWNQAWAQQYSGGEFHKVERFLTRSRRAARNQRWLRWGAAAATTLIVILAIAVAYFQREANEARTAQGVLAEANKRDQETRARDQEQLKSRIAVLEQTIPQTGDRDVQARLLEQLVQLRAELSTSRESERQAAETARKASASSTDLQAALKSLQSLLARAQQERDDAVRLRAEEVARREAAEANARQLEARLNSPSPSPSPANIPPPIPSAPQTTGQSGRSVPPSPPPRDYIAVFKDAVSALDSKQWARAAAGFQETITLQSGQSKKPESIVRIQGSRVMPYAPYYYLTVALLGNGDCEQARGAIDRVETTVSMVQRNQLVAEVRQKCP